MDESEGYDKRGGNVGGIEVDGKANSVLGVNNIAVLKNFGGAEGEGMSTGKEVGNGGNGCVGN